MARTDSHTDRRVHVTRNGDPIPQRRQPRPAPRRETTRRAAVLAETRRGGY